MAYGHLPAGWQNKRVAINLLREQSGALEGLVTESNEGGFVLDMSGEGAARSIFVPWSAVAFVELLESPSDTGAFVGRA